MVGSEGRREASTQVDEIEPGRDVAPGAISRRRVVLGGAAAAAAGVAGLATPAGAAAKSPLGDAIGPAKEVPVGQWAAFTDPKTKTPSLVIQLHKDKFVAYDAICPHEGCTIAYQPSQGLIVCPCHGSEFDPANGHVVHGPATRGLKTLGVALGPNGELYVKR
jgi:thiosulfate dehydrogenase [quinone] large subunit